MEGFNQNREGQVWQRVLSTQPSPRREGLRSLRREAAVLMGAYRQLSSALGGRPAELAGVLYREEAATAACLRGLEVLLGEDGGKLKSAQTDRVPATRLLQDCYQRTRGCLTEYMARTVDGQTGGVFRQLANRAEQQCARIAELMGML